MYFEITQVSITNIIHNNYYLFYHNKYCDILFILL